MLCRRVICLSPISSPLFCFQKNSYPWINSTATVSRWIGVFYMFYLVWIFFYFDLFFLSVFIWYIPYNFFVSPSLFPCIHKTEISVLAHLAQPSLSTLNPSFITTTTHKKKKPYRWKRTDKFYLLLHPLVPSFVKLPPTFSQLLNFKLYMYLATQAFRTVQ